MQPVGGHEHDAAADDVEGCRAWTGRRRRRAHPVRLEVSGEDLEQGLLALTFEGGEAEDLAGGDAEADVLELAPAPTPRGSRTGRSPTVEVAARWLASLRTPAAASPSMASTIAASPPSPGTNEATSRPSRSTVHMSQCSRTSARRWEMNRTERLARATASRRTPARRGPEGRAAVIWWRSRVGDRTTGPGPGRACAGTAMARRGPAPRGRGHRGPSRRGAGARRRCRRR